MVNFSQVKEGRAGSTHLIYQLLEPSSPGEVQRLFGIEHQGMFALAVKNPHFPGREAGTPHMQPAPGNHSIQRMQHVDYEVCRVSFFGLPRR